MTLVPYAFLFLWELVVAPPVSVDPEPVTALPAYVREARDDHLVVAAYNIKWLGQTPKNYDLVADIVGTFDICGILEVKREQGVKTLVDRLNTRHAAQNDHWSGVTAGPWRYVYGVKTKRQKGSYYESYAVVWRSDRVALGNGLVSNVWDREDAFRNDPFLVSFHARSLDFTLLFVHTRFTDDEEGSLVGELRALGEQVAFLRGYLDEDDIFLLGDFNANPPQTNQHNWRKRPAHSRRQQTALAIEEMSRLGRLEQLNHPTPSTLNKQGTGFVSAYDHVFGTRSAKALLAGNKKAYVMDVSGLAPGSTSVARRKALYHQASDHLPIFFVIKKQDAEKGSPPVRSDE